LHEDGEDWVLIAVSDTGIGIPPDKIDHVFAEFSQADNSTTREYGGTGLGLSISRRFCQMMRGDILLESVVGQGSTFTIRLPIMVEKEMVVEPKAPAAITPLLGAERTVLVIDDDPYALDLVGRTLQGEGIRVVTASDGREGLRLAKSLLPVAITLDVMMPEMDGWDVLRELKADPATADIPVIMLSMTDDRSLGFALGATDFLTKPVERASLVRLLKRCALGKTDRLALVVDDLPENRAVLRRALELEGWTVSEAENGKVALDAIAQQIPAVILLDLMMPVMDGFEFVHEVRQQAATSAIPIVVVTAKDITQEDRRRLHGSVFGLIEKNGQNVESLLAQIYAQVDAANAAS